jgi:hypothetical protein
MIGIDVMKYRTYKASNVFKDPFSSEPNKVWLILDSDKQRFEANQNKIRKTHTKFKERDFVEESVLFRF